jgi:hypothetical protein
VTKICQNGFKATTAEIPVHSFWQMYHWQSENDCLKFAMLFRRASAALLEIFSITPVMTAA